MPEVAAALAALRFDSLHAVTRVAQSSDRSRRGRPGEARPSRVALELVFCPEQLRAAAGAQITAGLVIVPECAGESALRSLLAQDAILLRRQFALPLLFGLDHLVVHDRILTGTAETVPDWIRRVRRSVDAPEDGLASAHVEGLAIRVRPSYSAGWVMVACWSATWVCASARPFMVTPVCSVIAV